MAEYAAAMVTRYGPQVGGWTPLNEPAVTADFSGRRGVWPPHLRGIRGYDRVLVGVAEGIVRTIAAIRELQPAARIVVVEPCEVVTSDEPQLAARVRQSWQEVVLSLDLVLGRVDEGHPIWARLVASGVDPRRLERLAATRPRIDVLGVNFYPNISRARLATSRGGVRRRPQYGQAADLVTVLAAFHAHTGLPLMITETSDNAPIERRTDWLNASVAAVAAARGDGLPVVGYTWFPVFSHVDWRWRRGPYERAAYWCHMGLWDLDEQLHRNRTPLADRYAALVSAGPPRVDAAATTKRRTD